MDGTVCVSFLCAIKEKMIKRYLFIMNIILNCAILKQRQKNVVMVIIAFNYFFFV